MGSQAQNARLSLQSYIQSGHRYYSKRTHRPFVKQNIINFYCSQKLNAFFWFAFLTQLRSECKASAPWRLQQNGGRDLPLLRFIRSGFSFYPRSGGWGLGKGQQCIYISKDMRYKYSERISKRKKKLGFVWRIDRLEFLRL